MWNPHHDVTHCLHLRWAPAGAVDFVNSRLLLYAEAGVGHKETAGMHKAIRVSCGASGWLGSRAQGCGGGTQGCACGHEEAAGMRGAACASCGAAGFVAGGGGAAAPWLSATPQPAPWLCFHLRLDPAAAAAFARAPGSRSGPASRSTPLTPRRCRPPPLPQACNPLWLHACGTTTKHGSGPASRSTPLTPRDAAAGAAASDCLTQHPSHAT